MFFPYRDDNPHILTPYVTYGIIAINSFLFLLQMGMEVSSPMAVRSFINTFGLIPSDFGVMNIFTSMFIHGGFAHIIGNMWFLWIFGDNVESALGHVRYIIFYFVCGIAAALLQVMIDPSSSIPMVGASGAIAGVLGAYMIRYPRARVHVFVFIFIFITTIQIPAFYVLGFWFLMQLTSGLGTLGPDATGGVAWFAHIGGFIAGIGFERMSRFLKFEKV
ncbi:MAG: rhomboid family intramembrane serine protease [Candidatus Marinimicrobia bacterium]|jgi:membrane associated rhomboid family serine protease|nr:rhomboid family intramembrane serine protease [Candidatus Neomarinimicrobiota bacterium]MBT3617426.1 rhomboid family intramembrane serine protease [Candidatus Neomarinimicrobiota bacterium]MBT3829366.1 rhomboid family intramembrane serine protease [Candidatus Neomarinimicrobiota bacterium]MBT3997649.1 rhomboid family intramembrane serine protease [Candidatus Neomarinimicrobiota bacterium]MBT4280947.1 rhomboid family intramembrane serine protease [Candidatus Neomarinimicrobiota bacterium]